MKSRLIRRASSAALMLSCLSLVPAALAQPGPVEWVPVIIGFNRLPGASEQALVRSLGGVVRHTYSFTPAIAARVPRQLIQVLDNHPLISVVEPDVTIHAIDEYTSAWGVQKINAKLVHDAGNRGQGLKVCVIDTGIAKNHPELSPNYEPNGSWDYVNNDPDPEDDNGHGTHVAGSIAAALNGAGVVGAAHQARILAFKILNAQGSGQMSDAIAAVDRCRLYGGKITNNSYGSSGDPGSSVKAAFDSTYNAGMLHVAASGNATSIFTCNSVSYPARYDSVMAVGATDSGDAIASFSCRGPEVEVSAPGVSITSTYLNNGYASGSGTSMASPHVAGTAALVFGCGLADQNADGVINNIDVRLRLQNTALDLGSAGRDNLFGFGRIRADVAATNCNIAPPPPPLPTIPGNFRVTSTNRTYISLAWNDAQNETSYQLERCTGTSSQCASSGAFSLVATLSANTTSYTNTGLARRTTYTYRLRGVNSAGPGGWSSLASGTTR